MNMGGRHCLALKGIILIILKTVTSQAYPVGNLQTGWILMLHRQVLNLKLESHFVMLTYSAWHAWFQSGQPVFGCVTLEECTNVFLNLKPNENSRRGSSPNCWWRSINPAAGCEPPVVLLRDTICSLIEQHSWVCVSSDIWRAHTHRRPLASHTTCCFNYTGSGPYDILLIYDVLWPFTSQSSKRGKSRAAVSQECQPFVLLESSYSKGQQSKRQQQMHTRIRLFFFLFLSTVWARCFYLFICSVTNHWVCLRRKTASD